MQNWIIGLVFFAVIGGYAIVATELENLGQNGLQSNASDFAPIVKVVGINSTDLKSLLWQDELQGEGSKLTSVACIQLNSMKAEKVLSTSWRKGVSGARSALTRNPVLKEQAERCFGSQMQSGNDRYYTFRRTLKVYWQSSVPLAPGFIFDENSQRLLYFGIPHSG